jgi:hypothetical protein
MRYVKSIEERAAAMKITDIKATPVTMPMTIPYHWSAD